MVAVLALLIAAAVAALLFFKGNFLRAFAVFVTALCAEVVAFAYFEPLASLLISRNKFTDFAQPACFLALFVISFAVMMLLALRLSRQSLDLGLWPERIGRALFGLLGGLIITGVILVALALAPLSNKIPYQRFDSNNPLAEKPQKALLNPDGFATGFFSLLSRASLSGKRSFAVLHPDFLNQLHLNRLPAAQKVPTIIRGKALEIPKKAVWPVDKLSDTDGKTVSAKSGHRLFVVRVGVRKNRLKDAGTFAISQIRLCAGKNSRKALAGSGKNIYPLGYIKAAGTMQKVKLTDKIRIDNRDFKGQVKYIDFVFEIPEGYSPAVAQLKQNNVEQLPPAVTAKQAPPPMPFVAFSKCATTSAELKPLSSANVHGLTLATKSKLLEGSTLAVSSAEEFNNAQTEKSKTPAKFDEKEKLTCVRAELTDSVKKGEKTKGLEELLKRPKGYELLSLKCNNPKTTSPIKPKQLPILLDAYGIAHHPAGLIAAGKSDDTTVWQVDYCCTKADDKSDGLVIEKDGSVSQTFIKDVWLTEKTQQINEFYLLYLVKTGRSTIIIAARPSSAQTGGQFKNNEGFLIR